MAVYWYKYRGKPTGKMFTFVGSNKLKVEQARKRTIKKGFKCGCLSKSYGNVALIHSGKVGK